MREICLARLDKTRPVLVLTRAAARPAMTKVTVAPITSTVKGLSSEVPVGPRNGLDHDGVVSLDNVLTIPADRLGRTVGFLGEEQEEALARAVVLAYDLDIPLMDALIHEPVPERAGGETKGGSGRPSSRSARSGTSAAPVPRSRSGQGGDALERSARADQGVAYMPA